MKTFLPIVLAITLAFFAPRAFGEEKNGLLVTVTKKTLDRNDTRLPYNYGTTDRIDRTQGLRVSLKNTSFKELPAGEVIWTLLVRKYNSSDVEGYTGKEPLQALKPADQSEMTIGSAQINGWGDSGAQAKDKIEYQIVVMQAGKETIRVVSTSSFDSLAKRATYPPPKATPPNLVPSTPAPTH